MRILDRSGFRAFVALFAAIGLVQGGTAPSHPAAPKQDLEARRFKVNPQFGKLPLAFEPNVGQTDAQVRFIARGAGMTAFFTDTETDMVLNPAGGAADRAVVRMKLAGSDRPRRTCGAEKQPGISNYFIGNNPSQWHTGVPHYGRIQYESVYPGIDLVWYGNQRQLEYDFIVQPGGDAGQIQVAYEGVESLRLEANGDLMLRTAHGEWRQQKPKVYQEIAGRQVEVAARYSIVAHDRVTFALADYDRKRELRIDPVVLAYSTYLGGSGGDVGQAIAVDSTGAPYITGYTSSVNFPTLSAYETTLHGSNVFVTKLTPKGDALVYSTYLGGSVQDFGEGIAVDAAGSAYITGYTKSSNFPTQSAFQPAYGGSTDAFVTKLSPAGNALIYSTNLGGSGYDQGNGIAVDASGSAYVTGETSSLDFPLQSAYQSINKPNGNGQNVFVTKLTPAGTALSYSTYLGGSTTDYGYGIAVDAEGSAYVTGMAQSSDFPIQSAFQTQMGGGYDAFVTKFTPAGSALVYSTYLGGGNYDLGFGIAVDTAGSAYVTGYTASTDFPLQSPYQATNKAWNANTTWTGFVTKLSAAGTGLVYSTYLGGSFQDSGQGIAVDPTGSAYVAGITSSSDFPTQSAFQATYAGYTSAFVTQLTPAGTALQYSTYLGGGHGWGIAVDKAGSAYVAGSTLSTNFPTQSPYQKSAGGGGDAFLTKLSLYGVGTAPFGSFDTPVPASSNVSGSVGFTGWALSVAGISTVDIWREPNPGEPAGLAYIGTANLVLGARPDVQGLFPNDPENASAGWGFLMLTNELPSNNGNTGVGNGSYNIHAIAHDFGGLSTDLGTKTIVVDNKDAVTPFGGIDTPTQGGTASGSAYVNFGWALTPLPATIPINGSTIWVYIDNVAVGHPVYNNPRSDIQALFPGYNNTNGAVGYFVIDTTKYTNGVHSIAWIVTDNQGHASGIGSRFFTVQN